MLFRERLLGSLRAVQPVLDVKGVLVGGSQVPNLLEPEAAATLVVSQDVDLVVPVERHGEVKAALELLRDYSPSSDEPSVWIPRSANLLEVNFIGRDAALTVTAETYVFEDDRLPLLVFGLLSLLEEGSTLELLNLRVPLPRPAGLALEKLLTERGGLKGERDLLVALGLLLTSGATDLDELGAGFRALERGQKDAVLGNLSVLSLMKRLPEMPDPTRARDRVARLVRHLEDLG